MRKYIAIICLLILAPCYAVPVQELYTGAVPVTSQADNARSAAVQRALQQVLIKVSGNSGVIAIPSIAAAVNKANNYLQAYAYHDASNNGNTALLLQAQFDPDAINHLLTSHQQAIWGKNRPLLLIWLAIANNQQGPQLIGSSTNNEAQLLLQQQAKQRAIPIIFPILDLTDLQTINVNDIWNANTAPIRQTSKRYGADVQLVIHAQQTANNQWNGQWLLLLPDAQQSWNNQAADLDTLVKNGVDHAVSALAAKYAVVTSSNNSDSLELTVVNIKNLTDFAKLDHYLKTLTAVKQMQVEQLSPTAVTYLLQVAGGSMALQQSLSLDHRLQLETNTTASSGLIYQWQS